MTVFPTKLLLAAVLITASGAAPAFAQFSGPIVPRLTFPVPAPTDGQDTVVDCTALQACPTES
jgi:hypothetical protein